jgi:pectate lyase
MKKRLHREKVRNQNRKEELLTPARNLPPSRPGAWVVLGTMLLWLALAAAPGATAPWRELAAKPDDWYRSQAAQEIITNVLSWQTAGGWPKNMDTTARRFAGDTAQPPGTFDNGATTGELRFLARAYRCTQTARYRESVLKGIDLIRQSQYPSGGWPQLYPPGEKYHRHITYNDNTMVRLMEFLREVERSSDFEFVDAARRQAARESFQRGIECILRCQIVVNGRRTVWCAQHDEIDYRPRPGRTFELVSLSGAESASLLQLLMSIEAPSSAVIQAVEDGVKWFEAAKLTGLRQVVVDGDKQIIQAPEAPPLWARFYELESNRPIFAGRDGVKKYALADIEGERRNGYAWYGSWGEAVFARHAKWKKEKGNSASTSR